MSNNESNTAGIVSLVCGIVGFFIFGLILGTVAIISGAMSADTPIGKAGLIVGIVDVVAVIFFLIVSAGI